MVKEFCEKEVADLDDGIVDIVAFGMCLQLWWGPFDLLKR